jgi:hypothetical protein
MDRRSATCPARPIRVSCSIRPGPTGREWAESEVSDVDWQTRNERGDWNPSPMSPAEREAALAACRDRWALVKALVLGQVPMDTHGALTHPVLTQQRDTVFGALAEMAKATEARTEKHRDLFKAMGDTGVSWSTSIRVSPSDAADALGAYVERLIEQAGVLP